MNTNLPIGLFDSGVGGLTVLAALRARLPRESILYLGDTARLPYGAKSPETIRRYALQCSRQLAARGIKMLVVACNTASATALPDLAAAFPELPVLGVVGPGAAAGCRASRTGRIAVIGTRSTIEGGAYQRAILELRDDAQIVALACPLFVSLAEEGLVRGPVAETAVRHYLEPVFSASGQPAPDLPDCLVLGCTHFPLLQETIAEVVGPGVKLVDSAATTAEEVKRALAAAGLAVNTPGPGRTSFLTTDDPGRFACLGSQFLGASIRPEDVELIDL